MTQQEARVLEAIAQSGRARVQARHFCVGADCLVCRIVRSTTDDFPEFVAKVRETLDGPTSTEDSARVLLRAIMYGRASTRDSAPMPAPPADKPERTQVEERVARALRDCDDEDSRALLYVTLHQAHGMRVDLAIAYLKRRGLWLG